MWLHFWHPQSIFLTLGGLTIHWYGVTLALGALAGLLLLRRLGSARLAGEASRQRGFRDNDLGDLFLWALVGGFVGGRLYHVLNELGYYVAHPAQIFMVWQGGLGIHGALLSGLTVLILFARRRRLDTWKLLDVVTPAVALGQVIGRWGNYFNQELFGRPTSLPWGIPIDPALRPSQYAMAEFFHPTFLYESLGNLVILFLLLWIGRHKQWPTGTVALAYFIFYALLRILTESLRVDQTPIFAGVRLPILVSGVMILTAGIFLLHRFSHGTKTP